MKNHFRLTSYNIHKGFSYGNIDFVLGQIKVALDETQTDILCLQEVIGEHLIHEKNIKLWPKRSQFEFLADSVWHHYAYGKNAVTSHSHHGNAILSKFPIVKHENFDISTNRLEQRGLLHAILKLPEVDKKIHIFNVHLDLFKKGRFKQVEHIIEKSKHWVTPEDPLIVAGDFNDWHEKLSDIMLHKLKLSEVHLVKQGKHAKTFPSFFPTLRLDRIYFRNLEVTSCHVYKNAPWNQLSDHLAVSATFKL